MDPRRDEAVRRSPCKDCRGRGAAENRTIRLSSETAREGDEQPDKFESSTAKQSKIDKTRITNLGFFQAKLHHRIQHFIVELSAEFDGKTPVHDLAKNLQIGAATVKRCTFNRVLKCIVEDCKAE